MDELDEMNPDDHRSAKDASNEHASAEPGALLQPQAPVWEALPPDVLPGRVLAIDYGLKRIGLALSDPAQLLARGLETLSVTAKTDVLDQLCQLARQHAVTAVVLGLPRHMDGREGDLAEVVYELGDLLAEMLEIPVAYMDERLTSVMAERTLREKGVQPSRQKHLVDQEAARQILQDYLDAQAHRRSRRFTEDA
ncbi:MAG: Holliday junction resolvase RuvX [Candidatus Melainabacteria bacterium]|nr:Holliday junction resolvase RuvX [Candidatus Melainabacteria bacterium]